VVALVGQSARAAIGGSYQQEVYLHSLFKDVANAYVQTMMAPEQARHLIDRVIRIAIRGTTFLLPLPATAGRGSGRGEEIARDQRAAAAAVWLCAFVAPPAAA